MIELDLNVPEFQQRWFALEKEDQLAVLHTCGKIASMTWDDAYRDRGLKWEAIRSRDDRGGRRLYTIRVTKRVRAVVRRAGNHLVFLTLHPDHDSAYNGSPLPDRPVVL